jgi:hypothetical protein
MACKKASACPICGKPGVPDHAPFCSSRCKQIDLGRWLGEVYMVPGEEVSPAAGTGRGEEDDEE